MSIFDPKKPFRMLSKVGITMVRNSTILQMGENIMSGQTHQTIVDDAFIKNLQREFDEKRHIKKQLEAGQKKSQKDVIVEDKITRKDMKIALKVRLRQKKKRIVPWNTMTGKTYDKNIYKQLDMDSLVYPNYNYGKKRSLNPVKYDDHKKVHYSRKGLANQIFYNQLRSRRSMSLKAKNTSHTNRTNIKKQLRHKPFKNTYTLSIGRQTNRGDNFYRAEPATESIERQYLTSKKIPHISTKSTHFTNITFDKQSTKASKMFDQKTNQPDYDPNYSLQINHISCPDMHAQTVRNNVLFKEYKHPNDRYYAYDKYKKKNRSQVLKKQKYPNFGKMQSRQRNRKSKLPYYLQLGNNTKIFVDHNPNEKMMTANKFFKADYHKPYTSFYNASSSRMRRSRMSMDN